MIKYIYIVTFCFSFSIPKGYEFFIDSHDCNNKELFLEKECAVENIGKLQYFADSLNKFLPQFEIYDIKLDSVDIKNIL